MHKFLLGVVMFGVGVVTASDDDCGEQMETFAICSERYRGLPNVQDMFGKYCQNKTGCCSFPLEMRTY